MIRRQRFTAAGWLGAIFFVLSPSISTVLATSSFSEFIYYASNRYMASDAADAFYHPAIYLLLVMLGLIGAVMMLIGRETYEVRAPELASTEAP